MDEHISLVDSDGRTRPLTELEREAVMRALDRHRWNVTGAARALGVTKATLYNRARNWGLKLTTARNGAADMKERK